MKTINGVGVHNIFRQTQMGRIQTNRPPTRGMVYGSKFT